MAEYWSTFRAEDPKDIVLRYRSAPWTDIMDELADDLVEAPVQDQPSDTEEVDVPEDFTVQDSPTGNISGRPPPPTWCEPFIVVPDRTTIAIPDAAAMTHLTEGIALPPPRNPPRVFISTHPSWFMDQVIQDLQAADIIRPYIGIVNAFPLRID
jgi:hypothetical protein